MMKLVGELDLLYLIGLFMALIYCFLLFKILAIREDYQYFSWRRKAANYLNKGNVLAKETRKIKLLRGKIKQQNKILRQADEKVNSLLNGVDYNEEYLPFYEVLKDMNGNIFIIRVASSPTKSFNQVSANSIITINFNFVEQGKWNVQEDLYKNRLTTIS